MWERGERPFCPFCAGAVDQRVADHSRELRGPPGAHCGAWGWRRAPGADSSFLQEHLGKGGLEAEVQWPRRNSAWTSRVRCEDSQ